MEEMNRATQPTPPSLANISPDDGSSNFTMVDEDLFSSKKYEV